MFTGGGTEADNLAVKGAARAARAPVAATASSRRRSSTRASSRRATGWSARGSASCGSARSTTGSSTSTRSPTALDDRTVVVSVMLVNNEVGTIQPLDDVAALVRERAPARRPAHRCRAGGAVARRELGDTAGADLVAISAHKFGGPKGAGALVVRGGVRARAADRKAVARSAACVRAPSIVAGVVAMAAALEATDAAREVDVRTHRACSAIVSSTGSSRRSRARSRTATAT